MDKFLEICLSAFLIAGTAAMCGLTYIMLTEGFEEERTPPPVPVESIPGGTEWKYEPIPAPYGDTFTFSPGIFNLGDN